ncbi:hypothetical protein AB4M26_05685, partial [Escherichia coli]|uniref:hypothetical protein n=1 Tax=Escherichia coli TaxID=562 RepID=UPI003CF787FA
EDRVGVSHQAVNAGCALLIRPTNPERVGLIRRVSVASGVTYLMRLLSDEIRNTLRSSAARL